MIGFSNFIARQSKILLENKQNAILAAIIFALMPFASWLSVALVALVTLRKGAKAGFDLLLPALVMHSVPLMILVPVDTAIINSLLAYLPCYFAAISLRKTMNWQLVCGMLLLQAFLGALLFQMAVPHFVTEQFAQLKAVLSQYHEYDFFANMGNEGLSTFIWSQMFFGVQILSAAIATVISLLFARAIQAKIYIPGGLRNELLAFRSGRLALLALLFLSLGAYYNISLAMNLLPMLVCYFIIAGFSLAYCILARKRQLSVAILLLLLILLKPVFVLFAYVIIGTLDSIFNFRLYLPARAKEST